MIALTDLREVLRQAHCWPLPLPDDLFLYLFDLPIGTNRSLPADLLWLAPLCQQSLGIGAIVQSSSPVPVAAQPVMVNGQPIGVLALVGSQAARVATPLANALALLAVKEEELNENTGRIQDIYEQVLFLLAISKMVTSSAPLQTLLQIGLKEGVELLRVQGGMVLPTNPAQRAIVLGAEWTRGLCNELIAALQRHDGVVLCNTREQCDQFCPALNGRLESLAAAEIWLHGEPELGLLLFNKQSPLGFLSADRQLVSFVAEQLQTVLRRDHLLATQAAQQRVNREIELASEIYQTLVPHSLPQHPALDLAVVSRPARQLGGDFYAVDQLPGGELLVIVGDAAGKGLPAALIMSQTLATLRAVAHSSTSGPAQILARSYVLMERMLDNSELFVTVFVGQFDPTSGRLCYADAGHGLAQYRQAATGEVQRLRATGTPLGALFWHELDECEIVLAPNDKLLVVSDGVVEMPSSQAELFGIDRLGGLFGLVGHGPSHHTLARLEGALVTFADGALKPTDPAHDDVTALLIQRQVHQDAPARPSLRMSKRNFVAELSEITPFTLWMQGVALAVEGWDGAKRYECVLAAVECFTNIVRHAYETHAGNIEVTATMSANHLELVLRDTGAPLPVAARALDVMEQPDPELLAEGGYGLFIMQSLADEIQYHSDANGNVWRLSYRYETEEVSR